MEPTGIAVGLQNPRGGGFGGGKSELNFDEKNSCQENRRRVQRSKARIKDMAAFWSVAPRRTSKLEMWFQRGDGESKDFQGRGGTLLSVDSRRK